MKGIIIPICIILLILIIITINFFFLKSSTEKLTQMLEASVEDAKNNDFQKSTEKINQFTKEYKSTEKLYSIFIRHAELDEIRILTQRVNELCTEETKTDFLAETSALKDMISHLFTSEKIILQNVL